MLAEGRSGGSSSFATTREIGRRGVGLPEHSIDLVSTAAHSVFGASAQSASRQYIAHVVSPFPTLRSLLYSYIHFAAQVIDDADHYRSTQTANFRFWWPRLRDGGIYVIEDIFVPPLPWRMVSGL
jgi:hypothetical protein